MASPSCRSGTESVASGMSGPGASGYARGTQGPIGPGVNGTALAQRLRSRGSEREWCDDRG